MRRDLRKVIDTCIKINDKTMHDVHCDISGAWELVNIRVYFGGWKSGTDPDYSASLYWGGVLLEVDEIDITLKLLSNILKRATE